MREKEDKHQQQKLDGFFTALPAAALQAAEEAEHPQAGQGDIEVEIVQPGMRICSRITFAFPAQGHVLAWLIQSSCLQVRQVS